MSKHGHTFERAKSGRAHQDEFRTEQKIEGKNKFFTSKAEAGDLVAVQSTFDGFLERERIGILVVNGPSDNPHDINIDGVRIKFKNLVSIEVIKKAEK